MLEFKQECRDFWKIIREQEQSPKEKSRKKKAKKKWDDD